MTRETITLSAEQHEALCSENELIIEGVEFEIVEDEYEGTGRHTEHHSVVFKLNDKFYKVGYEISVKDSMGWKDCNWQEEYVAEQVFPEIVQMTIYR